LEWNVATPGGSCCKCNRPFPERQDYWSALFPQPEGFNRTDYCLACWKGPEDGTFSFWRARSRPKPAPPRRFVNDQVLLEFFERLCESDDDSKRKFRFIMAVLLLRKKLLRETSRKRDEQGIVWKVEVPRLGKAFHVRDEGLTEPEIAQILSQIGQVLNLELKDKEDT